MHIHLNIIGIILIVLALIHIIFPRYFNWEKELKNINLANQQIMIVHTFFIALTVGLIGVLCVTSASELIETNLGKKISLGLGVFWLVRLFFQFFVYSPKLWRGKPFETSIHILFSILWCYFSSIFLIIAI
ncbi:hypothetical protein [uncultured Algibacter sp.]|uniref:hypothetical protein n=1 Tax=uncultured Algibacter sp. TaxID=298659 RepID=UPI0032172C4D